MRACCSTQLVPKPPTSSEEVFAPESWDLGFGSWSTCCRIASVLSFCLSDPSPTSTNPSPSPHHISNPLFSTSTITPAPNPLPLAYELGGKQQNKNKAYVSVFFQPAVIPQRLSKWKCVVDTNGRGEPPMSTVTVFPCESLWKGKIGRLSL